MALTGGQKYEPVKVDMNGTGIKDTLEPFIFDNCVVLDEQWAEYINTKLPEYRRVIAGRPLETKKSFPWERASNIVVQLVGASVSTLRAKIIASIYEMSPLWPVGVVGTWDTSNQAEEQRAALETFLSTCGLSTEYLDLYRVENLWCYDMIGLGQSVVKIPYEKEIEYSKISIAGAEPVDTPITKEGPIVEKIPAEDFQADIKCPTLKRAPFKRHILHFDKQRLLARKYSKAYDAALVDKILQSPDSAGPSAEEVEKWQKEGFDVSKIPSGAYWNICECWFTYWVGDRKYRMIASYHQKSRTILRCVYNWYPDNEEAFVMARMGFEKDGLLGRGYADLLKDYQEEVTVGHNQRVDKRTLLNTNIFRVGPNTRFDSQFRFRPMMTIVANEGDFAAIPLGQNTYPDSVNDEMLTLKLGEDLTGVGQSTSGMGGLGSGTVGKTTGAYSSMGTYSVMQDGNKRVAQNITDFKYAHMELGRMAAKFYAHFGADGIASQFGLQETLIKEALDNLIGKKLFFPIKAATASINREVEKQNYLLLEGQLQRFYTAQGQLIQAADNPQCDPVLKNYLIGVMGANNSLMTKILKAFDLDDVSKLLPKTPSEELDGKQPDAGADAGAAIQGNSVVQNNSGQQTPATQAMGQPGVQAPAGILPGI